MNVFDADKMVAAMDVLTTGEQLLNMLEQLMPYEYAEYLEVFANKLETLRGDLES